MNKTIASFTWFLLFTAIVMAVEVRRDEKWPPKMLVEWFRPAATECKEKTGVTEEAIKEFDSGEIHEDASLKCYMYCVFEVLQLINDRGDMFVMRFLDHIESNYDDEVQSIALNMGRKCLRSQGDNKCEKAFWYHKCWKSQDPVIEAYITMANFLQTFLEQVQLAQESQKSLNPVNKILVSKNDF